MSTDSEKNVPVQSDVNQVDHVVPLENLEQEQEEQQNQQSDWTSGIDVVELGSTVLDAVGDLLSGLDIDF
ncbi:hypothetical protein EXE10_10390 [Acinetobacter sp. WCHAc060033]|uniref:Uncharacterized protein n=1 Tax=Acinetobacter wuhouensis TaxID=1879050 RepID=A0A3G2T300_9GAMM|nr:MULTISPECIES: hypothetical protein [Acinetobacter]AYO54126.1 hypothetical protein CDG68_10970 [Acinetobacter wuhouensis]RZG84070.1 hypothetical protein EXE10_10390 [Acinetobacter sp. WCHAc060033]